MPLKTLDHVAIFDQRPERRIRAGKVVLIAARRDDGWQVLLPTVLDQRLQTEIEEFGLVLGSADPHVGDDQERQRPDRRDGCLESVVLALIRILGVADDEDFVAVVASAETSNKFIFHTLQQGARWVDKDYPDAGISKIIKVGNVVGDCVGGVGCLPGGASF